VNASDPIENLKNLGVKSAVSLHDVGVHTIGDLQRIGAVEAFARMRMAGKNPSLVYLWALVAGLRNEIWTNVSDREKRVLVADVEAIAPRRKQRA
jgi:DNA transformation protein